MLYFAGQTVWSAYYNHSDDLKNGFPIAGQLVGALFIYGRGNTLEVQQTSNEWFTYIL